ncbi:hypothetical protein BV25DRAFT_1280939 [Artomyces pyxidatus]|uniref:Uncharacterized protein n=1 Tax=Artomyces pyxidatus TaxID=48021 RepID=A0ACB8TFF1_9AGAM|nr:hypothetical protein BV25DRAFT_1280939 [Artomyces pyxidatus]
MSATLLKGFKKHLTTAATDTTPLFGTVPQHQAYILLHRHQSPRTFPSRLLSPLQVALRQRTSSFSGLVNFAWTSDHDSGMDAGLGQREEYSASAFAPGCRRLFIPSVSMENIDDVSEKIQKHVQSPPDNATRDDAIHLYVCTHGARDCRCGDLGGGVADALREEVRRRRAADPAGPCANIVVGEVGHVGGHKHAANLLVFPHGDWLGMLRPENVHTVLDAIIATRPPNSHEENARLRPLLPALWRGRMGLSRDQQLQLYSAADQ